MACGTPAVVSRVGGMKFTVVEGSTGYHVEPNDPAGLADRLALLLTDASLRVRLGRAARARVEEHFTWPTVARRVAGAYGRLLGTPVALAA
jgi:glycosyltransferase involved in cell wall biosynthesis